MNHSLGYARTLSHLVRLLSQAGSTPEQVRDTLRLLVSQARETATSFELADEWKLCINGEPVPPAVTGLDGLAAQLHVHGVQRLDIRQFATAGELVRLARLLAEAPRAGDGPTQGVDTRVTALKLWNVLVTMRSTVTADVPSVVAVADDQPPVVAETVVVTHHLARVRGAATAPDAAHALGELAQLADAYAAVGNAAGVAEIMLGVVRAERDAVTAGVAAQCAATLELLAKPQLTRLVAQMLPAVRLQRDFAEYRDAVGRCGTAGAAALIAHLMAADTIEERRVFFDVLVELRIGIPMLTDALGHPQWFVVRNAACLLGEMRATEADASLARLLDHRDGRVREAAAGALARLDTPIARMTLQRMIQDGSAEVRLHAAGAFAGAGQTKVATPLAAALDVESDSDVQLAILAALGRLGTPDAVQKLVKAISPGGARGRPVSYRSAALEALAAARGNSALPALRSMLSDDDPAMRDTAKRLLASAAVG